MNTGIINGVTNLRNNFIKYYALTGAGLLQLADVMNNETVLKNFNRLFANPVDNILALKVFPFYFCGTGGGASVAHDNVHCSESENIKINVVQSGVAGRRILPDYNTEFNVGSYTLNSHYIGVNNFLNFEPYTKIDIFLPFYGWVNINTNLVMDKTITIKYYIDISTGSTSIVIKAGADVVGLYNISDISVSIPLSTSNKDDVLRNYLGNLIDTTATALTGNIAGTVGSAVNLIGNTQFKNTVIGTAGNTSIFQSGSKAYIRITRPDVQTVNDFGRDFGFLCVCDRNINDLHGFTKCLGNIKLNNFPSATDEEMTEIKRILSSGFYTHNESTPITNART